MIDTTKPLTLKQIGLELPRFTPMPLRRMREPLDDPDWLFELKYDGFRALAFVRRGCSR